MKRTVVLGVLMTAVTFSASSQEVIIDYTNRNGTLSFGGAVPGTTVTVEWASSVGTSGGPTWRTFTNLISGADAMTIDIPMFFRVFGTPSPPPYAETVLIPAATFVMGNATNVFSEGHADEIPQHTLYVSPFDMDRCEVTLALWNQIKAYNGGNGYDYSNPGSGTGDNHPVHTVNWYDAVKWCNARSEKEGLTPVYYTNALFTTVYKTGQIAPYANWSANGYRLPTEAEWEKAARGGSPDTRFPWTDFTNRISHAKANYHANPGGLAYDVSPTIGYHPDYNTGETPYTSPVGSFPPNGYGLYDMAGNVWEWCWDWYDSGYYASSPGIDPKGPAGPLSARQLRGGSWQSDANGARCAYRNGPDSPANAANTRGFRCVRAAETNALNVTDGLVAYYPFNNNASDGSGNGHDGVLFGPVATDNRFGVSNAAFAFDGISNWISVAETPGFEANSHTISIWVKADRFNPPSKPRTDIIGKFGYQWIVQLESSGKVRNMVMTTTGEKLFDSVRTLTLGTWYHIVQVWDGATLSTYINGAFDSSIPADGNQAAGSGDLIMGGGGGFNQWFQGKLDDVRIYDRALSPSEVSLLYNIWN